MSQQNVHSFPASSLPAPAKSDTRAGTALSPVAPSPSTPSPSAPSRLNANWGSDYQMRATVFAHECFGAEIAADPIDRSNRALEEMLEVYQALGNSEANAIDLVHYVFSRKPGNVGKELGSAAMTLAILATACRENLVECAEAELARVFDKIDIIRAKRAAQKPGSPLPGYADMAASDGSKAEESEGRPAALVPGDALLLYQGEGIGTAIGISLGQLQALIAAAQTISPLLDIVGELQQIAASCGAVPHAGKRAVAAEEALGRLAAACASS